MKINILCLLLYWGNYVTHWGSHAIIKCNYVHFTLYTTFQVISAKYRAYGIYICSILNEMNMTIREWHYTCVSQSGRAPLFVILNMHE